MIVSKDDFKRGEYPHIATGFDSWVCWMYLDQKRPFAPYSDLPYTSDDEDDKFSWSNPANLTGFDTAREWGRKHPKTEGVGFILQHESDPYREPADPLVLVDFDDVVDKETGKVHPFAWEIVQRSGTYADLSDSYFREDKEYAGIHCIGVGEIPENIRTVQDELPEHPDFPDAEIEIYDRKRFCAMSGVWLTASNREVTDITYWIKRLARRFDTTTPTDSNPEETVDIDNEAYADVDYTDDFDDVADAIDSVGRRDIKLKSGVTNERSSGVVDYDPSYRTSDSRTGLAWFPKRGVWCDRDGQHYMDALQIVALEEGIISRPTQYPEGEKYWKAVERLRERGANIPRYTGSEKDRFALFKKTTDSEEEAKQTVKKIQTL